MRRREALRAGVALVGAVTAGGVTAGEPTATTFRPTGRLSLSGTKETVVGPDGEWAYVAATDGYATVDLSDPTRPRLAAKRRGLYADRDDGPMTQLYDAKLDGETLAVVGPANPAPGTVAGAVLVDVSDPAAPETLGLFETDYPIHNCAFADGVLYLTGNGATPDREANPMVVVDASDPTAPEEVARWGLVDHDDRWADVSRGVRPLHDLWVRDGLAALAYWDAGTLLVDVSDPTDPTHLGTVEGVGFADARDASERAGITPPGNHHYVATDPANELLGIGKESWGLQRGDGFVGGPSGIELVDVSDPTDPRRLANVAPPPTDDPTLGGHWTTAHNFELRDETLYASWYDGGVKRFDVSDPANPTQTSWWVQPDRYRYWTARTVTPGETFLAASFGWDGHESAVHLFPDAPGTGGTPELLTPSDDGTPAATPTSSPTTTATPAASPTPPATDDRSLTTTDGAAATPGEPNPTADDATETGTPGFGAAAAVGGIGVLAWHLRRNGDD